MAQSDAHSCEFTVAPGAAEVAVIRLCQTGDGGIKLIFWGGDITE